jgi:DNA-binding MarR family transcriptional regulator
MKRPRKLDLARRSWTGLRTIVFDRYDRRREVADALGMSFVRSKALRRLAKGPLTLRGLAEELTTDAPYTTIIVDDLEARGLLERTPHPTDRRAKLVSLTTAGIEAARTADRILAEPPDILLALDEQDLIDLDRIVAKLLAD